jgi:shikimate kinase
MTDHPSLSGRSGRGLVLIGYRGSGKSTVGRIVAGRLTRPFVDTDCELELQTGRSIAALFSEGGEVAFRDREERALAEVTTRFPEAIIATGGGAVLREANRRRIREFGFVAWLSAPPDELARRLEADQENHGSRPALTAAGTIAEIVHLLAARAPIYREVADAVVETEGRSPETVAAAVIDCWRNRGD